MVRERREERAPLTTHTVGTCPVAGGRTQTRGRLRRCERSASAAAPRWHRVDRGSPCVPAPREHRKRVLRWPQHQRRAVLAAVADRNAMWVRREGVPEAVRPCSHQFRRCSRTYAPLRPHPNSFLASSPQGVTSPHQLQVGRHTPSLPPIIHPDARVPCWPPAYQMPSVRVGSTRMLAGVIAEWGVTRGVLSLAQPP